METLGRSVFINVSAVANAQNQDILSKDCTYDPVVANTKFPETGKFPLKERIMVGPGAQFLLDLVENASCLGLAESG
jgi:hypothetical protein